LGKEESNDRPSVGGAAAEFNFNSSLAAPFLSNQELAAIAELMTRRVE
jgi:hypothetical protein